MNSPALASSQCPLAYCNNVHVDFVGPFIGSWFILLVSLYLCGLKYLFYVYSFILRQLKLSDISSIYMVLQNIAIAVNSYLTIYLNSSLKLH